MKYACLIYQEESKLYAVPKDQFDAFCLEHVGYERELDAAGNYIVAEALDSVRTAATVRVREGRVSVTDGPFAETKEQLGGFFLIEAPDLDEAIRLASRIPSARTGCVEVRPVREVRDPAAAAALDAGRALPDGGLP